MSQGDSLKNGAQEVRADIGTLYEPPPVEFSFEAPGWTFLLWICIVILIIIGIRQIHRYKRNKYRREALRLLENSENSITDVFVILKRTAMHAFGRAEVGSLSGSEWLAFLDASAKGVDFNSHADVIASALYKETEVTTETRKAILSTAKTWIRTHAAS